MKCAICYHVKSGEPFDAVTVRGGTAVCEYHMQYAHDEAVNFAVRELLNHGNALKTDADFLEAE